MRLQTPALAAALFFSITGSGAQESSPLLEVNAPVTPLQAPLQTLTLAQALKLAEAVNPTLGAKKAQLDADEGLQASASGFFNSNPQLSVERTRRMVPSPGLPSERYREWSAGLSQTIEIAGQRGYRRDAADASLSALRAEIADTRRQVIAEVTESFYRVMAWQQRTDLETRALKLFESTARAIEKRRAAGEDTRLDANVALVEAERARNQLAIAQEQLLNARNELAAKLQFAQGSLPLVIGDFASRSASYRLVDLLSNAEAQPRLRALTERENSADARLKLERASRIPDITIGANVGREGRTSGRERLTTFSVSVPLPLFQRNQAGIGQALTELSQARIERQAAQRDTRANVSTLWSRLSSLDARVQRLQQSVLTRLDDNETLSLKSQRAGQIGLLELIVVNRQSLDARRDLIDAQLEYQTTRVALEYAAGWPQEGSQP